MSIRPGGSVDDGGIDRGDDRARSLAMVAVLAAFIAVLGIPGSLYPFGSGVPITLQSFGVMLAASLLGARRGAAAVLVVIALVAAGLPLLAGGRGGLGVFAGPTVGYLAGWVLGALVIGWLLRARRGPYRFGWGLLANVVGGIGAVYALGVPVQAWLTGTSVQVAAASSLIFLPGDLVKAALAAAVASSVHRAVPDLTPAPADRVAR